MVADTIQAHILTAYIDSQPIRRGVRNIENQYDFADLESHYLKHHMKAEDKIPLCLRPFLSHPEAKVFFA